MSRRSEISAELAAWVAATGRFTAPYGIIEGIHTPKSGKGKARCITFGVARVSDIMVCIWSENYFTIWDSRYGDVVRKSVDEVKDFLKVHYSLEEPNEQSV